jgi:MFS family permease
LGFQPEIIPSSLTKMSLAGSEFTPLLTWKREVWFQMVPVGFAPSALVALGGIVMTSGFSKLGASVPSRKYCVATPDPLSAAVAPSPAILIVSRIVLGLAIGLASTNVPVYLSEVAPPHARGWVVSLFQLAVTVGIVVAYLTDYAFAGIEGWRWMLGLAVAPALLLRHRYVFSTGDSALAH